MCTYTKWPRAWAALCSKLYILLVDPEASVHHALCTFLKFFFASVIEEHIQSFFPIVGEFLTLVVGGGIGEPLAICSSHPRAFIISISEHIKNNISLAETFCSYYLSDNIIAGVIVYNFTIQ